MSFSEELDPGSLPDQKIMDIVGKLAVIMHQGDIPKLKTYLRHEDGDKTSCTIRSDLDLQMIGVDPAVTFDVELETEDAWFSFELTMSIEDLEKPVSQITGVGRAERTTGSLFENLN